MTEKLHVIDGVTYREVERKAKVGDYVVLVRPAFDYDKYSSGTVFKVTDFVLNYEEGVIASLEGTNLRLYEREYRVLEPVVNAESAQPSEPLLDLIAKLTTRLMRLEDELDSVRRNVQTFAEQTEANTVTLGQMAEALGGERQ